ncbi:MAG TPA: SUMF1/EgtB/PvdO family nonheme iron enzyme [Nitrospiria bacterium]|nr:SUMF1/EgtB/PvdO family nonheme iron enzyme [Nitrospiria bacterium]
MKEKYIYAALALIFLSFVLMLVSFGLEKIMGVRTRQTGGSTGIVPQYDLSKEDYSSVKTLTMPDGTVMDLIPAGLFIRGSRPGEGDTDEMPQMPVYVSAFYIDQYEVRNGQYTQFTKATRFPKPFIPFFEDDITKITAPDLPAVGVSWDGAVAYCKWAGQRLPTEAEWEKAARWEDGRSWSWGNAEEAGRANLAGNDDGFQYTAPPGSYKAGRSPYGPYDMIGNVNEWVADWYQEDYYAKAPPKDPKGPEKGKDRVFRGGSWNDMLFNARAAKRFAAEPHRTDAIIGFRCAMDLPEPTPPLGG